MASEWGLQNPGEVVVRLGDFNGLVAGRTDSFEGVHGGYKLRERNVEGKRLLEFFYEKELCVASTWFEKKEQKKTSNIGGNKDWFCIGW